MDTLRGANEVQRDYLPFLRLQYYFNQIFSHTSHRLASSPLSAYLKAAEYACVFSILYMSIQMPSID